MATAMAAITSGPALAEYDGTALSAGSGPRASYSERNEMKNAMRISGYAKHWAGETAINRYVDDHWSYKPTSVRNAVLNHYRNEGRYALHFSGGQGNTSPVNCGSGCFNVNHPRAQFAQGALLSFEPSEVTVTTLSGEVIGPDIKVPQIPDGHWRHADTFLYASVGDFLAHAKTGFGLAD
jgi:hypothetical protein